VVKTGLVQSIVLPARDCDSCVRSAQLVFGTAYWVMVSESDPHCTLGSAVSKWQSLCLKVNHDIMWLSLCSVVNHDQQMIVPLL